MGLIDPKVFLVEGGKEGRSEGGSEGGTEPLEPVYFFFLGFAVIGLCVDAVVAVHFDLNRIRLERLFSIFFLQRQLPVRGAERERRA